MVQLVESLLNSLESSIVGILILRFTMNLIIIWFVTYGIYYRKYSRKEYLFTFLITNVLTFFVSSILSVVTIETGMILGLFAFFSIVELINPNRTAVVLH